MKSVKQKAKEWVNKNVILSEHCDIEYSELIDKLELLLKGQDRDTRHACAEACLEVTSTDSLQIISKVYHDACMNTTMGVK